MKRDLDLIRLLLIKVEGEESVDLGGFSEDQILYHKDLLIQSGFVKGKSNKSDSRKIPWAVEISNLTPEGHDFLDNARDRKVWKRALNKVKSTTGSISIALFKEVLKQEVKQLFSIDSN